MAEDRLPTISRRNVLTTTGAVVTGGAVVAFGSSGTASAQVEVAPLDISDASVTGDDGTVSDVRLDNISGNYQYTVEQADTISIILMVAPEPDTDNWEPIASVQETAMSTSTAGTYTLSGSVLDHPAIDADEFNAEPSETATREIPIRVIFDVLAGGEIQVTAIAETVATATVENTAVAVSAEVTGSGSMEVAV